MRKAGDRRGGGGAGFFCREGGGGGGAAVLWGRARTLRVCVRLGTASDRNRRVSLSLSRRSRFLGRRRSRPLALALALVVVLRHVEDGVDDAEDAPVVAAQQREVALGVVAEAELRELRELRVELGR